MIKPVAGANRMEIQLLNTFRQMTGGDQAMVVALTTAYARECPKPTKLKHLQIVGGTSISGQRREQP